MRTMIRGRVAAVALAVLAAVASGWAGVGIRNIVEAGSTPKSPAVGATHLGIAAPTCSIPTATSVGPTGTLTAYTGPTTISTNGAVIDSVTFNGSLVVNADNVTIRNSRILGATGANYVIQQASGHTGLTITNSEVGAQAGQHPDRAIASFGSYMTVDHSLVHGTQRGIQTGQYTTVTCSYSDDFDNSSGNHATGVMSLGGTNHVTLLNNAFGCGTGQCSAAMSVYPQTNFGGPNNDWLIQGNLFNGGSYCVYLGYSPSSGESPNTNIRMIGNLFGTKYDPQCGIYGPVGSWYTAAQIVGTGNVWSGNTFTNGTAIVEPSDPNATTTTTGAPTTSTSSTTTAPTTTTVPATTTSAAPTTTTVPPTTTTPTTACLHTVPLVCTVN